MDVPVFYYGDVVRVLEDMVEVHRLQAGHGEWNDDMALVKTPSNIQQSWKLAILSHQQIEHDSSPLPVSCSE